ncbi:MFS transporter, partial [Pseudomonas syringae pv. tagetis]
ATLSLANPSAARPFLALSQGHIGVRTISRCIGKLGPEHTARSISWNRIASYCAIAIVPTLGVLVIYSEGITSLGVSLTA